MATPKDFPEQDTWYTHYVSYGETDAMAVLYHAEYLHLFERSRSQFIRESGLSYREAEARGIMLPVRDAACRYRTPARYDERIHVRCGISKWGRASVNFVYEIWNDDKTVLHATGSTSHACVNLDGKPIPIPGWLRDLFQ
ncbi:thioesterase family protein [Pseudodesulfovibrio thermohalotolerans]|uniref:acyl-CoA thioesterase n=1 Tax=Pseudodesulfovibrio thermohalotolerans TaxID=2880651 RepID=UPI0022B9F5A6|nr:thioesterase family protein [Pseudodesulfovibrio thermohalotolerans]WFS61019.1 thioesterase family protein [Pseudodesulfovibrio thermohalotolerans]